MHEIVGVTAQEADECHGNVSKVQVAFNLCTAYISYAHSRVWMPNCKIPLGKIEYQGPYYFEILVQDKPINLIYIERPSDNETWNEWPERVLDIHNGVFGSFSCILVRVWPWFNSAQHLRQSYINVAFASYTFIAINSSTCAHSNSMLANFNCCAEHPGSHEWLW